MRAAIVDRVSVSNMSWVLSREGLSSGFLTIPIPKTAWSATETS